MKYAFVSNKETAELVKKAAEGLECFKGVFTFDKVDGEKHWSELTESGKQNPKVDEVEAMKKSIDKMDLLTILYTSGTTGNPKGVMLSHNNLLSNMYAAEKKVPIDQFGQNDGNAKVLSFLPLNHVYERMLSTTYIFNGVGIYYAESIDTIADNLQEVHPDAFASVPRIYEKVYDKIYAKGEALDGFAKKLFFWALDLGFKYELDGKNGWWFNVKLGIARKLIFSKWKEAVGGMVVAAFSGGAPLQPRLARIFAAAGIPICEGYGLTETSPIISTNSIGPGQMKFGTVGQAIEGVTVKIAEDGEICVKGPNVMMGYYNNPEATKEVIDEEGFFHTGDIGVLDSEGFLKITDRKKQIFKTSGGKYIAPSVIENKIHESVFIDQAMVIGEYQKFASALIVPSFEKLQEWCPQNGIPFTSNAEVINNEKVKALIIGEIEKVNKDLAQFEKIKQPVLLPEPWSVESGELTPKLSFKRKVIMANNEKVVEEIYQTPKS